MATKEITDISLDEVYERRKKLQEKDYDRTSALLFAIHKLLTEHAKQNGGAARLPGEELQEDLTERFKKNNPNTARLVDAIDEIIYDEDKGYTMNLSIEEDETIAFGTKNYLLLGPKVEMKLKTSGGKLLLTNPSGLWGSKSEEKSSFKSFPVKNVVLEKDGHIKLTVKVSFASKSEHLEFPEILDYDPED